MAYEVRMINDDVMELKSVQHSFVRTIYQYFYTNINTWEDLTNPSASFQENPTKVARQLDAGSIEWAKKNYLPKIKPE